MKKKWEREAEGVTKGRREEEERSTWKRGRKERGERQKKGQHEGERKRDASSTYRERVFLRGDIVQGYLPEARRFALLLAAVTFVGHDCSITEHTRTHVQVAEVLRLLNLS